MMRYQHFCAHVRTCSAPVISRPPAWLCRAEPPDAQNAPEAAWSHAGNPADSPVLSPETIWASAIFSCNTAIIQLILNSCLPRPFPTCVLFVSQHATLQPQVSLACFGFSNMFPPLVPCTCSSYALDSSLTLLRDRPLYKKYNPNKSPGYDYFLYVTDYNPPLSCLFTCIYYLGSFTTMFALGGHHFSCSSATPSGHMFPHL